MKTFNKAPSSVKQYGYDDLNYQFFNHSNWKGLCDNKNYIGVDQETFEECNNVYIDENALLSSRPAIKRDKHFDKLLIVNKVTYQISDAYPFTDELIVLEYKKDNQKYLKFVNSNYSENVQFYIGIDNYKLVDEDNKIFIFADNVFAYYDKSDNIIYSDNSTDEDKRRLALDKIYVPITKNWNGTGYDDNESPNEFTPTELTSYVYTNVSTLPDSLIGKTVVVQIDDNPPYQIDNWSNDYFKTFCTKKFIIDDNVRLPKVFYEVENNYSNYPAYPLLFISDNGAMIKCTCVNKSSGKYYSNYEWTIQYSVSGNSFETLFNFDGNLLGVPSFAKENGEAIMYRVSNAIRIYKIADKSSKSIALPEISNNSSIRYWLNIDCVTADKYCFTYDNSGVLLNIDNAHTIGIFPPSNRIRYSITINSTDTTIISNIPEDAWTYINLGSNIRLKVIYILHTAPYYAPCIKIQTLINDTWKDYDNTYLYGKGLVSDTNNLIADLSKDTDRTITNGKFISLVNASNFFDINAVTAQGIKEVTSTLLNSLGCSITLNNLVKIGTDKTNKKVIWYTNSVSDYLSINTHYPSRAKICRISDKAAALYYMNTISTPAGYKYQYRLAYINVDGNVAFTDNGFGIGKLLYCSNESTINNLMYTDMRVIDNNLMVSVLNKILKYDLSTLAATEIITLSETNFAAKIQNNAVLSNYTLYELNQDNILEYTYNNKNSNIPIAYAQYVGDTATSKKYIYYVDNDGQVYSSRLPDDITIKIFVKNSIDTKINHIVPTAITKLNAYYFARDNKLYISAQGGKVQAGEFKWYFPKINTQLFVDNITNLHPISKDDVGIFFDDHINYVHRETSEDKTLYYYYTSKIQLGCRLGNTILTTFDGKYITFATKRGIVALSYQNFVATDEQTLTYLSDNIFAIYDKWNTSAIKLLQYKYWIICYRQDNETAYVYDLRNNSWWPITYDISTKIFVFKNKLHIVSDNDIFVLDTAYNNYKDTKGNISWKIKSQKLHFNALNYYKHINNITLNNVADDGVCTMTLKLKAYRKVMNESKDLVFDIPINFIRTFVKHLSILKTNEFQYQLTSDDTVALNSPLRLSNITIKYKITGQVR